MLARRRPVRPHPRRPLRARSVVPRLWCLAVLPTARHGRPGDRGARHLPRLRRRASARVGRAVARPTAGDVPPVSSWAAARRSFSVLRDALGEAAYTLADVPVPILP